MQISNHSKLIWCKNLMKMIPIEELSSAKLFMNDICADPNLLNNIGFNDGATFFLNRQIVDIGLI